MAKTKDSRRVFPVVACPASDHSSLCHCELTFRFHQGRKEASIALKVMVAVDGSDDMHTFAAQYDADNLSTTAFGAATVSLSQTDRDRIARNADPEMMTLSLHLQTPCKLWCPARETMAPKPGSEESFNRLAHLARATTVHITLDYGWAHKYLRGPFERLVHGQDKLFTTGYPLGDYYREQGLRLADWTVFSPVDAAAAPPTYDDALRHEGAVTKRPNQGESFIPVSSSFLTQLIAQLQPQIQPQLQGLYNDAIEESGQLRANAELELSEAVDDHKLDVGQLKEDTVEEVQRVLTTTVEDARAEARDLAERLSYESYQAVVDRLDTLET
ncbi:hypothetical protein N0V95_000498, partial [Ascochyta clinopodiicola]